MILNTKTWLNENFKKKDMSETSFILWIEITCERQVILFSISHEQYINYISKKFRIQDYKSIDTLITK